MPKTSKSPIQAEVEKTLLNRLKGKKVNDEVWDGVKWGIKYLAVQAKLDEATWGEDLEELNERESDNEPGDAEDHIESSGGSDHHYFDVVPKL